MKHARGFTLVELMIAVSILAIGIVFVLRSFLTNMAAIDTASSLLSAVGYLETRLDEYEEKSIIEDGLKITTGYEDIKLSGRDMHYALDIKPVAVDELKDDLNEVKVTISWNEETRTRDEILAMCIPNKK